MSSARQTILATFVLLGLIYSGQAEAHDFVVMHRTTFTYPQTTCGYSQSHAPDNSPSQSVNCLSGAYVFDRDNADVYLCNAGLQFGSKNSDGSVYFENIHAECVKQPNEFKIAGTGTPKLSFYGEGIYKIGAAKGGFVGGDAFWISQSNVFRVQACFSTVAPTYFGCADASVK